MALQKPNGPHVPPPDDLYTTLLIVAAVVLFAGILFIGVRSQGYFGSLWPPGGG